MRQVANNELAAIIEQSSQTANTLINNYQFLNDALQDFRTRTLSVNPGSALPLIKELKDSLSKTSYAPIWPFLYLLIAYTYFTLNDLHAARIMAEDAVRKFTDDDWNLALARWFLAIIYREDEYFKDAKEQLVYSLKTFTKIINQTTSDDVGWKLKKECKLLMEQVRLANEALPIGQTRLLDSARRDQKEKFPPGYQEHPSPSMTLPEHQRTHPDDVEDLRKATGKLDQQAEQNSKPYDPNIGTGGKGTGSRGEDDNHDGKDGREEDSSAKKNEPQSMNLHINIPIDIRTSDYTDQNSTQYLQTHQEQATNQDAFFVNSNPVNLKYVNLTEPLVLQSDEDIRAGIKDEEANTPIQIPEPSYLLTPGLPIYGKASAGPDGHIVLAEPDYQAAIDESSFVRFEGQEYEVHALKNGDHQISITYRDFLTSIIPKQIGKTGGKAYGWLKVIGNSMNTASPIPIKHGDYVLVFENRILIHGKIVVVSYLTPESGEIRLLIKRLLKRSDDKKEKWFLHSESLNNNPETGEKYEDLEMGNCYQVIGDVIAIAKPHNTANQ